MLQYQPESCYSMDVSYVILWTRIMFHYRQESCINMKWNNVILTHVTLWSAVMLSYDEPELSDTMDPNHVILWPWILILLNLFPIHSEYYHHCCFYPILVKCILYKGANVYCSFIYSWCIFLFFCRVFQKLTIYFCAERKTWENLLWMQNILLALCYPKSRLLGLYCRHHATLPKIMR